MKRICDPFAYGHGPVEHCYWNDTIDAPPRLPLEDDIASVAYWYQAEPHAKFPPLPEVEQLRIKPLKVAPAK